MKERIALFIKKNDNIPLFIKKNECIFYFGPKGTEEFFTKAEQFWCLYK